MEKLLVLTDFTTNAAHAAAAAVQLCGKLNMDLLLYHSVQYIPIVPDYGYGSTVTETPVPLFKDSKEQLAAEAERLNLLASTTSGYKPEVRYFSGEGSIGENIRELSGQSDIRFLIMGGRSSSALDHLLNGSETTTVIRVAKKPVLIIPETARLDLVKKVCFTTNFASADIPAIHFLLGLAQVPEFQLEIVHVLLPQDMSTKIQPELTFRDYLEKLDNPAISFRQLSGDHIGSRLEAHCRETGVDLLAMTHGRHSRLSRVFGHSESEAAIARHDLAVMIFPPDFIEHN